MLAESKRRARALPLRVGAWSFAVCLALTSGCGGLPGWQQGAEEPMQDSRAQVLMREGNFAGAAEEYLRLAKDLSEDQAYPYRIYAAEAYLEAHSSPQAQQVLSTTRVPSADRKFSSWLHLLLGRIAMENRDLAGALTHLKPLDIEGLPRHLQAQILKYRAAALERNGDDSGAFGDYLRLDPLLERASGQIQGRNSTWMVAKRLAATNVQSGYDKDPVGHGWLELARAVNGRAQAGDMESAVSAWRQRFPEHPANSVLQNATAVTLKPDIDRTAGGQTALLLPLSGQFGNAGAAVRDGIVAAWYSEAPGQPKGKLAVYDVSAKNVAAQYKRALTEGATGIVGPLDKGSVNALLRSTTPTVPIIVLNQIDAVPAGGNQRQVVEFGLAPEDEARLVAERAWFDGHARAYMLVPDTPWGERIAAAFRKQFESIGGKVSGIHKYMVATKTPASDGGKETVANELDTATDSVVSADIGSPTAGDADFIFLGAFPQQGRHLAKALTSARIALPTYATSHIYSGRFNPADDRDLEGVMFCDMPWLLDVSRQSTGLAAVVKQMWPTAAEQFARLHALGIDAYHLLPYMDEMRTQAATRFDGETGVLAIDTAGHVRRQPAWARFVNGTFVPLDPVLPP